MDIPRYYTVGAVVPDARSLKELGDRIEALEDRTLLAVFNVSIGTVRKAIDELLTVDREHATAFEANSGRTQRFTRSAAWRTGSWYLPGQRRRGCLSGGA